MHNFNLNSSSEEIAKEIIKFPDGVDFAETNLFQVLILGKPEERDPKRYAEIFAVAASETKPSSWMRFACWAENINGLRRAKDADMKRLVNAIKVLAEDAKIELPNGELKYDFLGRSYQNLGIMRRTPREYSLGAMDQYVAGTWYGRAGKFDKQVVCFFIAKVEETSVAFFVDHDELIKQSVANLITMRDFIANASDVYPTWMEQNASIHIAWAVVMANLMGIEFRYPDFENDFQNWKNSRFSQWAKVAVIAEQYFDHDFSKITEWNPVNLESSSADNATLTVLIFTALADKKLAYNPEQYEKILNAVANYKGPDGGIPIAVATRLLKNK